MKLNGWHEQKLHVCISSFRQENSNYHFEMKCRAVIVFFHLVFFYQNE
jgi:hypothetical protein